MKFIALLVSISLTALSAEGPELSSSAVSEAEEQLVGQRAHMTNEIHLLAGGHFIGPAVTMRLVRDEKASGNIAGLMAIKLIEAAPAGSVWPLWTTTNLSRFSDPRSWLWQRRGTWRGLLWTGPCGTLAI